MATPPSPDGPGDNHDRWEGSDHLADTPSSGHFDGPSSRSGFAARAGSHFPHGQNLGAAPRYDPMTGKKLKQPTAPAGALFDPMTGKRLVKKRRSKAVVGLIVLLAVAVVGGAAAVTVVLVERSETNERKEAEAEREATCVDELSPLYDALVAVDGRMSTGANIQAFSDVVGQASAARSAVDAAVVDESSCGMFDVLSELVDQYGVILQGWNDCIFEYDYCDTDTDISVGGALSMVSLNQALISEDDLGSENAPDDEFLAEATDIAELVAYE